MIFPDYLIYLDLPSAVKFDKICAFSPKKPTKRQKIYISGRSRYLIYLGIFDMLFDIVII